MKSNSKLISTLQSSIENYEKANKTQSEQIENQNLIINELHSKLQDYEAIAMQNNELVKENQTLNDIIKNKNQMIAEFQKLTEESSNKFDVYINCNNELKSKLDEKKKKYKDIKIKYKVLNERVIALEKENEFLKSSHKSNETDCVSMKSELDALKEREVLYSKNNSMLSLENKKNNEIIQSYLNKIRELEKEQQDKIYLTHEIDKMGIIIESKDKEINTLQIINEEIRNKNLELEKQIAAMNTVKENLEKKNQSLTKLCSEYEITLNRKENAICEKKNMIRKSQKAFMVKNYETEQQRENYQAKIEQLESNHNVYQNCLKEIKNYASNIRKNSPSRMTSPNRSYYGNNNDDKLNYSHYLIRNLKDTLNNIDTDNSYYTNAI